MKQIFSESELKEFLTLPVVKLQQLDFRFNAESKSLDAEMIFGNDLRLTFVNVTGINVSEQFRYANWEDGGNVYIGEISSAQMENIGWEFSEYENGSIHFYCESLFVHQ